MSENNYVIPKPLRRYKSTIFMAFTWCDVPIVLVGLSLILLIWFAFPLSTGPLLMISFAIIFATILVVFPLAEDKPYVLFWRKLQYLFSQKTYDEKNKELLIPYEAIEDDGYIKLKTGSYIRPIELTGFNLGILHEQEQWSRIHALQNFIKLSDLSFSITKLTLPTSLEEQKSLLDRAIKVATKKSYVNALKMNKQILETLEYRELHYADKYFVLVYGEKERINKSLNMLTNYLNQAFLFPTPTSKEVSNSLINGFYLSSNEDINSSELKTYFGPRHIKMGNKFIRIYGITQFPKFAYPSWLDTLNQGQEYTWNLKVQTFDKAKATKKLDKVINNLRENALSNKKASQEATTDSYLAGLTELNELLHADGETIHSTCTFIRVTANTEKELENSCSKLVAELKGRNYKFSKMVNLQKEAWESMLPKPTLSTKNVVSLELPSISLALGFPFYSETHKDKNGLFIGYTNSGHNIFFDPWQLDANRQNSNIITFGTSGSGKSTLSKKLIKDQVITGAKVFAIDPEREYKKLCESLEGSWVNFGTDRLEGDKENVINPLQFMKNETGERSILSSHMQFLEEFFKTLFPSIELTELNVLRRYIINLYAEFKITSSNSYKISDPKQFPVIGDLVKLMRSTLRACIDGYEIAMLQNILSYLEVFESETPENKLWNAHTSFNIHSSDFVVMDTRELSESGNKRLANAQMFLLLKIINNAMVQNKILKDEGKPNKKMMIVVDEAHLLIDEDQPSAVEFMYQMAKRARKYDAMTFITTQNIKDFIGGSAEIRKKTSAIVNTCQYSFLLKLNPGDIEDLNNVYSSTGGLTQLEKDNLAIAPRGMAIMAIGAKDRKILQIDIADEEFRLWE